jgi:hypothetical protein
MNRNILLGLMSLFLIFSLFSGCDQNNATSSDTCASSFSDETSVKNTGLSPSDTQTGSDAAVFLNFDYVTTETPDGLNREGDDIIIVTSRNDFSALYEGKSGIAAKAMAYFTDDFFENHVAVVLKIDLTYNSKLLHADSVEKKGNEIIANYKLYSSPGHPFGSRYHTDIVVLSKDDCDGCAVSYKYQILYTTAETLQKYDSKFREESLSAFEKYKP